MKKVVLASVILAASSPVMAELSGSAGFVSDYVYRGSTLGDAAAYVGGEFSESGFTAGIWGIKDGSKGIEADVYASYSLEMSDDFSASLGVTTYNYSYRDGNEVEANIGAAFGPVGLDAAIGKINPDGEGDSTDYVYAALSGEAGPVTFLVGSFDLDSKVDSDDYLHFDISLGNEFESLGVSSSVTLGVKQPGGDDADTEEYLFLDVSKAF